MKLRKSEYPVISTEFHGTYFNVPIFVSDADANTTLLGVFELENETADTIQLRLLESRKLELILFNQGVTKSFTFKGKMDKRGYFEMYVRKNVDKTPWGTGIFTSTSDIKRIRIARTSNGHLWVDDYVKNSRTFLIFGVGGEFRTQSEYDGVER